MDKPEMQGCSCEGDAEACCRVEALVSVDERGQMVLPKDLREKAGIHPGHKLAVTAWERDGTICWITLTKVEALTEMVKAAISPVMRNIL
ncbi:MAG TPA: AbrB/MazE/SpoVT family DNA-binding domain-containing protein [Dehalococcoidia bacterium]|nr:AbrB/MazE/SpoVT family DNA-binding domain-containing protein [Dehalococcoidia bacterium]